MSCLSLTHDESEGGENIASQEKEGNQEENNEEKGNQEENREEKGRGSYNWYQGASFRPGLNEG